jgi:hypothetical protein
LTNGNCSEGSIQAKSVIIDSSSQFVMQNWCQVEANNISLFGVVYASTISFHVSSLQIYGGINTDGRGFGPALGPGAGQSDSGTHAHDFIFISTYSICLQLALEVEVVMVQMVQTLVG